MRNDNVLALALLASSISACAAPVGASRVPADAASTCVTQCGDIGMELSAVALMAGTVGCVCQATSSGGEAGLQSAVTAGMATITLQHAAAQQQRQRQQQQQQAK